jgi:uncharacterized membrane protein
MTDRLRFLLSRLRERLWIKPLIACILSVAGVLLAHLADNLSLDASLPEISQDSVIEMLKVIATTMLGVATFAVASMVSAYASAGQMATARAFPLIVADDVSQNALSTFIAAFIFSIVGLTAAMNGYYGQAGRFTLFVLMALVLAIVVLTFVRWVDRIARLGRVGAIILKVEKATAEALARRRHQPFLGGIPLSGPAAGTPLYPDTTGYLEHVDVQRLQHHAVKCGLRVRLDVLPGAYVGPTRSLCHLTPLDPGADPPPPPVLHRFVQSFTIGHSRQFDHDPRFGMLVLSEIACRALSPGINDHGTAISVIGSLRRLFEDDVRARKGKDGNADEDEHKHKHNHKHKHKHRKEGPERYDRVAVPALEIDALFDDAFSPIARDGAKSTQVVLCLLRHLGELGHYGPAMRACAQLHADLTLARAQQALDFPRDLALVRQRYAEYWGEPGAAH